jgi:hypothetical protein
LARNAWKYIDRDKRIKKIQKIDYEYLAPDTINEMFNSLTLLERYTGKAFRSKESNEILNQDDVLLGRQLLMSQKSIVNELEVEAPDFENTKRKVVIIKPVQAYHLYKELILFYAITTIINWMETENIKDFEEFQEKAPASNDRIEWINNGGQLMPAATVQHLIEAITNGSVNGWNDVHDFYEQQGQQYETDKLIHAIASLEEMSGKKFSAISRQNWVTYIRQTIATKEWMVKNISDSRAKDYNNPFRKMVYDTVEEMNKVMGKFSDNSFILQETKLLQSFKEKMNRMATLFSTELQPA